MTIPIPRSGIGTICVASVVIAVVVPFAWYWATAVRGVRTRPRETGLPGGRGAAFRWWPSSAWVGALLVQALVVAAVLVVAHVFRAFFLDTYGARPFFFRLWLLDHYLFLSLPILVPLLLVTDWVFIPPGRREPRTRRALLLAAWLGTVAVGLEAHVLGPRRLTTERVDVALSSAVALARPVRIALVGDIQTDSPGRFESEVVARVNEEDPDVILLLGDYIQESAPGDFERLLPAMRGILAGFKARHGVFAVDGDFEDVAALRRLVHGTGVRPLVGERVRLDVRGQVIHLYGLGNHLLGPEAGPRFRRLRKGAIPAGVHLVMSHQPDILYDLPAAGGPDLVLASHTHGGQVVLPVVGPIVNFQRLPLACTSGLHRYRGHLLYVTRGIGMERFEAPRVRFLCPPEITLITLRPPAGSPADLGGRLARR